MLNEPSHHKFKCNLPMDYPRISPFQRQCVDWVKENKNTYVEILFISNIRMIEAMVLGSFCSASIVFPGQRGTKINPYMFDERFTDK